MFKHITSLLLATVFCSALFAQDNFGVEIYDHGTAPNAAGIYAARSSGGDSQSVGSLGDGARLYANPPFATTLEFTVSHYYVYMLWESQDPQVEDAVIAFAATVTANAPKALPWELLPPTGSMPGCSLLAELSPRIQLPNIDSLNRAVDGGDIPFRNNGFVAGSFSTWSWELTPAIENARAARLHGTAMLRAQPNPMTGGALIRYAFGNKVRPGGKVVLYDASGRNMRTLSALGASGAVAWDGNNAGGKRVPSGMYVLELNAGQKNICRMRMMVVR